MKAKGKKFVSLFLVFSLLALSGNLYAKKKGAELVIQKKDGQEVRGELIAVKQNSLLWLDSESGADVSVGIGDIKLIKIMKISRAAAGIGFLEGAGVGALGPLGLNVAFQVQPDFSLLNLSLKYALIFGGIGAFAGGIFGGVVRFDETIQIRTVQHL